MKTETTPITPAPALSPVERHIVARLGGTPWSSRQRKAANLAAANIMWKAVREAVGFQPTTTGWVTTDVTNPKMGKAGIPTVGVTLHAAKDGLVFWLATTPEVRARLAAAVGRAEGEILAALAYTFCPRSTTGCTFGCTASKSANAILERSQLARLARTVVTLERPDVALTLTAAALDKLVAAHGTDDSRWRVNIADDIRWEIVAPALLDNAPKAYAYTKWAPADRPAIAGLSVVYSASERWTREDIVETCAASERVAVVFNCRKGNLPTTWGGVPVVDGDKTDDLFAHPAGVIVGLAVKGRTLAIRQACVDSGFAIPVTFADARSRRRHLPVQAAA